MGYLRYETPVPLESSYENVLNHSTTNSINLEKIIKDYVWKRYLKFLGCPKRFIVRKKQYNIDFRWAMNFEHKSEFKPVEADDSLLQPLDFTSPGKFQCQKSKRFRKICQNRHSYLSLDINSPLVLNAKSFRNNDSELKNYSFVTQRETTTKIYVEFDDNYNLGVDTNIHLVIPRQYISPVNKKRDCKLCISDKDGQKFKETVSWDLQTEISVAAGHRAKAFLSVQEQEVLAEFEVTTTMSLARKWLPVVIHRKSDNKVMYTCFITNLLDVFRRHQGPNLSVIGGKRGTKYHVVLSSRGMCTIRGWADQQIVVTSEKLDKSEIYQGQFEHDVEL